MPPAPPPPPATITLFAKATPPILTSEAPPPLPANAVAHPEGVTFPPPLKPLVPPTKIFNTWPGVTAKTPVAEPPKPPAKF